MSDNYKRCSVGKVNVFFLGQCCCFIRTSGSSEYSVCTPRLIKTDIFFDLVFTREFNYEKWYKLKMVGNFEAK